MAEGSVIHYVGAGQIARADHAECDAQVAAIVHYHETHGYKQGGAYNVHRCQHGGRWLHYLGPNQATGNQWANVNLHAICALIGDGDEPTPTLLNALYEETLLVPGGRNWITPHSYWYNTSCCGDPLRAWIFAGAPYIPIGHTPRRRHPAVTVGYINLGFIGGGPTAYLIAGNNVIIHEFTGPPNIYGIPEDASAYAERTNCGLYPMSGDEWKRALKATGIIAA